MKKLLPFYLKYKKVINPLVLLVLAIFIVVAVILPQISTISESSAAAKEANSTISNLNSSISIVQGANPAVTSSDLVTVTTALPTTKDIVLIFEALNSAAATVGVNLDDFSLKVGGLYGRAEEVDTGGVAGVPMISVLARTTGSSNSTVEYAKALQKKLPLSEIKVVEMSDGNASFEISFFYKPLDLSVLKQENVTSLTQADKNLINQLNDWNQ